MTQALPPGGMTQISQRKMSKEAAAFQRLNTPVLNLGESAFEGCVNLTGTIKLNANATSIGANAFKGCDKIDLILIPEAAEADIAAAGFSEEIPYVVYQYDIDTDAANFFIQDVHYGSKSQITFDGNIFDGTWSCGVELVCERTSLMLSRNRAKRRGITTQRMMARSLLQNILQTLFFAIPSRYLKNLEILL